MQAFLNKTIRENKTAAIVNMGKVVYGLKVCALSPAALCLFAFRACLPVPVTCCCILLRWICRCFSCICVLLSTLPGTAFCLVCPWVLYAQPSLSPLCMDPRQVLLRNKLNLSYHSGMDREAFAPMADAAGDPTTTECTSPTGLWRCLPACGRTPPSIGSRVSS